MIAHRDRRAARYVMSAQAGESVPVMIGVNYFRYIVRSETDLQLDHLLNCVDRKVSSAIQAATGANRSRPWKELDKFGGRQTIRRVCVFVARAATKDRKPLSGPTYYLLSA